MNICSLKTVCLRVVFLCPLPKVISLVCVYNITVISFRKECANLYSLLAATQKQPPVIQFGHSWPLPILVILFRTYDCYLALLLAHGRWFSTGTTSSSTTKPGRHDIAEILLKVALKSKNRIKIKSFTKLVIRNGINNQNWKRTRQTIFLCVVLLSVLVLCVV
jgi:hypothetical protein